MLFLLRSIATYCNAIVQPQQLTGISKCCSEANQVCAHISTPVDNYYVYTCGVTTCTHVLMPNVFSCRASNTPSVSDGGRLWSVFGNGCSVCSDFVCRAMEEKKKVQEALTGELS